MFSKSYPLVYYYKKRVKSHENIVSSRERICILSFSGTEIVAREICTRIVHNIFENIFKNFNIKIKF